MYRILFVCHGNICRSPMAEFILRDMVTKLGREDEFFIDSAATTREELGNGVYPPVRRLLEAEGIDCSEKRARLITAGDYDAFDLILGMDGENMDDLRRRFGGDRARKLALLTDYTDAPGTEIYDPWYTRDFQRSRDEIREGCLGLLDALLGDRVTLDFSECTTRQELFAVLRRELLWEDCYGNNLDALWDVLTGLPHRGKRFGFILPSEQDCPAAAFVRHILTVFQRAREEEEYEQDDRDEYEDLYRDEYEEDFDDDDDMEYDDGDDDGDDDGGDDDEEPEEEFWYDEDE